MYLVHSYLVERCRLRENHPFEFGHRRIPHRWKLTVEGVESRVMRPYMVISKENRGMPHRWKLTVEGVESTVMRPYMVTSKENRGMLPDGRGSRIEGYASIYGNKQGESRDAS